MKKTVRRIWVAVLSAVAFLVACVSSKGLSSTERANLIKERDSIQRIIKERESSCVYGSPEVLREYGNETRRLRVRLDSINEVLENNGPKKK